MDRHPAEDGKGLKTLPILFAVLVCLLVAPPVYSEVQDGWTFERIVLDANWGGFPLGTSVTFSMVQAGSTIDITQTLALSPAGERAVEISMQGQSRHSILSGTDDAGTNAGTTRLTIDGHDLSIIKKRVTQGGVVSEAWINEQHGVVRLVQNNNIMWTVDKFDDRCRPGNVSFNCRRLKTPSGTIWMSPAVPGGVLRAERKAGGTTANMTLSSIRMGHINLCESLGHAADRLLEASISDPLLSGIRTGTGTTGTRWSSTSLTSEMKYATNLDIQGAWETWVEVVDSPAGSAFLAAGFPTVALEPEAESGERRDFAVTLLGECSGFSWLESGTGNRVCPGFTGQRAGKPGTLDIRLCLGTGEFAGATMTSVLVSLGVVEQTAPAQ